MKVLSQATLRSSLVAFVGAVLCCVMLASSMTSASPLAVTLPSGFSDALVTAVPLGTALAFTPDNRLLIATQPGVVRVYQNGALVGPPVLDISAKLCSNHDNGMSGLAVDPQFATNHFIYVYYTWKKTATTHCEIAPDNFAVNRVTRFTLNNNTADPASETVLIDNIPSPGETHNGGDLHFGKDGYLYVSVGDGYRYYADTSKCCGANPAAQERNTLLGKIIRIQANGGVPPSNPYQGSGTARCNTGNIAMGLKCQEIFAYGLRHPFRTAFDPNATGTRFFINDVGQNTWEEVDEGLGGANYGWPIREGHCAESSTTNCGAPPAGITNPIFDYAHRSFYNGASITGGAFVPNGVWPAAYNGVYLFSDYVFGAIYALQQTNGTYTRSDFATGLGNSSAVHMLFGPYGTTQALYYTTYANGGQVRRVTYTGSANRTPQAVATATLTAGNVPLAVTFDGRGSSDPDAGDTLTYDWNFGDGSAHSAAAMPSHSYTRAGTFTATLIVRDNHGAASAPATLRIDAGNTPPTPTINAPTTSKRFRVGEVLTLQGSATDAQDGTLDAIRLTWTLLLHHNDHTHSLLPPTTGNNIQFQAPQPEDLAATANSYVEIQLKATDAQGLTTVITQALQPNRVNVQFTTEPAGLQVRVNDQPLVGPQSVVSWEAYGLNITAPDQQNTVGQAFVFDHWSDGGARSHTLPTPANAVTYTAVFRPVTTATPSVTLSATRTTTQTATTPTTTRIPLATASTTQTPSATPTNTVFLPTVTVAATHTPQATAAGTPEATATLATPSATGTNITIAVTSTAQATTTDTADTPTSTVAPPTDTESTAATTVNVYLPLIQR